MLDLSENLFTGKIPPQLGEMRSLETLNLSYNEFFGSIPATFGEVSSSTNVDISYNCLEGPLPKNKAFREALFKALRNNKGLCGNASSLKACSSSTTQSKNLGEKTEIGNMQFIQMLDLRENLLIGKITPQLGDL